MIWAWREWRAQARLRRASRRLARKEIEISDILRLRVRPRLTLVDEATALRATYHDREQLDADDEQATHSERFAGRPPLSPGRSRPR